MPAGAARCGNARRKAFRARVPKNARMVLVGEQPGDEEDRQGSPFVGPAGRLLRSLMVGAGIDVKRVYLTNAVKHFGWVLRGKRRMHKTPEQRQIEACRTWLAIEIAGLRPKVIVALCVTALWCWRTRDAARGKKANPLAI